MGDIVVPMIITGTITLAIFSIAKTEEAIANLSDDKKEKILYGWLPGFIREAQEGWGGLSNPLGWLEDLPGAP